MRCLSKWSTPCGALVAKVSKTSGTEEGRRENYRIINRK